MGAKKEKSEKFIKKGGYRLMALAALKSQNKTSIDVSKDIIDITDKAADQDNFHISGTIRADFVRIMEL